MVPVGRKGGVFGRDKFQGCTFETIIHLQASFRKLKKSGVDDNHCALAHKLQDFEQVFVFHSDAPFGGHRAQGGRVMSAVDAYSLPPGLKAYKPGTISPLDGTFPEIMYPGT